MWDSSVCLSCGSILGPHEKCVCFRTIRTIVGAQKPQTADRTAAAPPFWSVFCRWVGWSKRPRRRAFMEPGCVARMPEHRPDFRLEEMTRSVGMLDCFCAYVVLPCFSVLTVLSTIFIIVSVLDLFLWELLEIMKFPLL
jgi:hypothetical protein